MIGYWDLTDGRGIPVVFSFINEPELKQLDGYVLSFPVLPEKGGLMEFDAPFCQGGNAPPLIEGPSPQGTYQVTCVVPCVVSGSVVYRVGLQKA